MPESCGYKVTITVIHFEVARISSRFLGDFIGLIEYNFWTFVRVGFHILKRFLDCST